MTAKKENKAKTEKHSEEKVIEKTEIELRVEELEIENEELTDGFKRLAAEFDNYRKRTLKEKDEIYKNATASLVETFLPVIDNIELAEASVGKNTDKATLKKGMGMVYRQFREILERLDIDEIECVGESFDPEYHNAVMHVTDEKYGENEIVEVMQKGYVIKDRVIRHSIVKVAN